MKLIALFLSGIPFLIQAQQQKSDSLTARKWLNDIGLSYGLDYTNENHFSESDWARISGQQPDTFLRYLPNHMERTSNSYANLSFGFGLKPLSEKRQIGQVLRFSFGYRGQRYETANWQKDERYVIDTLTSSSTGKNYYIDSIVTYALTKQFSSKQYQFSVQYLVQTNREKRFSFYTGVGLGLDLITKMTIQTGYNKYSKTESADFLNDDRPFDLYSPNYSDFTVTPLENTKRGYGGIVNANVQIPVGMDFRISMKDNFLGRTVIGAEFLYKCGFFKIPDLKASVYNDLRFGVHVRVRV